MSDTPKTEPIRTYPEILNVFIRACKDVIARDEPAASKLAGKSLNALAMAIRQRDAAARESAKKGPDKK